MALVGILEQGLEKGKRRPSPGNRRQGAGEVGRGLLGMHFKHLRGQALGWVGGRTVGREKTMRSTARCLFPGASSLAGLMCWESGPDQPSLSLRSDCQPPRVSVDLQFRHFELFLQPP